MMRVTLLLVLLVGSSWAYYLPGTYPKEYYKGEQMQVETNSLWSPSTELPYDYYDMPFCKPPEGVKKSLTSVNPGTILMGTRIENSPFNFSMMEVEETKITCQPDGFYGPLSKAELARLKELIDEGYRVRLILDNLPVTTSDLLRDPDSVWPGFEVGFELEGKYYINNHRVFNVLVHRTNGQYTRARAKAEEMEAVTSVEAGGRRLLVKQKDAPLLRSLLAKDAAAELKKEQEKKEEEEAELGHDMFMVVGFEVEACSIERKAGEKPKHLGCPLTLDEPGAPKPQELSEGLKVVYTHDVYWKESDIAWASRWDAYLKMPGGKVHWFSIMNSLMVVVVMSCIVAMIMLRTIRRDLARYESLLVDSGPNSDLEESGWKMVSGDVFRPPRDALSLCVQLGSGVQILASAFCTLFFAALGFLSPASRGALLTAMLVMYLLLAVAAGYSSVWLWGMINRSYDGWHSLCWRVSCYFPGITMLVLTALNILIHHTGTTGAIPLGAFFSLISLWFLISTPLCYSGGLLAARKEIKQYPTRTNQIPRHIPPPHWASNPNVLFLAAGLLPFGTIFVELYFAMTSMWQGYFYYIFGFLFLVGILTAIITVEVAVVCTYVQLCAEDYLWWWRSFYRGGSIALYIFLYAIGFLFNTLHLLSGFLSILSYMCYMSLIVWSVYLAMGTVGFLSSFYFTYKIFDSVKAD